MYVTRISCYTKYIEFSTNIIRVLHNHGRSWNVLPVDTGKLLYCMVLKNTRINNRHFDASRWF
jgi:hypothetical protein